MVLVHSSRGKVAVTMIFFDHTSVARLADDAGSRRFALHVVGTYERMLPHRVERIVAATTSGDQEAAMDAALSLKVSSHLVGATHLAELAIGVEQCLRSHDLAGARAVAGKLPAAATSTTMALASFLEDAAHDPSCLDLTQELAGA